MRSMGVLPESERKSCAYRLSETQSLRLENPPLCSFCSPQPQISQRSEPPRKKKRESN